MKVLQPQPRRDGFTFFDLLIVLVTVAVALSLYVQWAARPRRTKHSPIPCVSNLKQLGLGARMWANDHQDKFPWQVPSQEGGTLEYATKGPVFQHFLALS